MRAQQTKLTPHRFAHPEKISQPGAQPETPSPSSVTAAACLTTRAYRSAHRGIVPRTAKTLGRKVCRAQRTQRCSISFCQHRGHANVSALRRQPNPALKRDVPLSGPPLSSTTRASPNFQPQLCFYFIAASSFDLNRAALVV